MDAQKVDMFMMMNAKYFESHHLNAVREKLLTLDELFINSMANYSVATVSKQVAMQ